MYKDERCIIIDESGNLGAAGRYFVIACINTVECKSLHNVMKRQLGNAKNTFPELALRHAHEIKASEAYPAVKDKILRAVLSKNIEISYIVADLKYIDAKLLQDKNLIYNYLTKLLLDRVITEQNANKTVNILCDNKTTKVSAANSLGDYIKLHFNYEKRYNINLKVEYLDSDAGNAYIIQAADYVANAIYSKYEYNYSWYYNILSPKIDIKAEFPWQKFSK